VASVLEHTHLHGAPELPKPLFGERRPPKRAPQNAEDIAVDRNVGLRIKRRRTLLGMSQTALAEAAGVAFQQIQKYEHGENRVAASRLLRLAKALDVPLTWFFDEEPGDTDEVKRDAAALARLCQQIESADHRRALLQLARTFAKVDAAAFDVVT
jgi:transcriptional regulator with XRE-family HTH domain